MILVTGSPSILSSIVTVNYCYLDTLQYVMMLQDFYFTLLLIDVWAFPGLVKKPKCSAYLLVNVFKHTCYIYQGMNIYHNVFIQSTQ